MLRKGLLALIFRPTVVVWTMVLAAEFGPQLLTSWNLYIICEKIYFYAACQRFFPGIFSDRYPERMGKYFGME